MAAGPEYGHHAGADHSHHIVPMKTLLVVFGALVFLTVFTVITARIDLGALNIPLALAIACTKAGLVLTFFMALKYDNRVNTLVFSVGAVFVVVFLVFTMLDTSFRGALGTMEVETVMDQTRAEEALRARDPGIATTPLIPTADTTTTDEILENDPTVGGAATFLQYQCNTCHSLDGSVGVGPTMQGLHMSERTMADGTTVVADEAYIRESIVEPDVKIVEGYPPNVMSATLRANGFYDQVSDAEIDALVAYLMEL